MLLYYSQLVGQHLLFMMQHLFKIQLKNRLENYEEHMVLKDIYAMDNIQI